MKLKITVSGDYRDLIAEVTRDFGNRAGLNEAIAEDLHMEWREHLREKYIPKDKNGIMFWERVHDSAAWTADETGGEVTLDHLGIWLRYHGSASLPQGGVTPGKSLSSYTGKPTRALSVPSPSVPVADGVRVPPNRAGLLAFIPAAKGRETVGYLVEGEQRIAKRGKNKGKQITAARKGGDLMYTLRTITRHKPDPAIIPDDERLTQIVTAAALRHLSNGG